MRKGTIDQTGFVGDKLLVIDCELLFDVKGNWLLGKKFELNGTSPLVTRYMHKTADNWDNILIGCVDEDKFRRETLKKLNIYYELVCLESEDNYKNWLWTVLPEMHVSINSRQLYHPSSIAVEEI